MNSLATLYRPSLALLTDLYQITMAYGYWQSGTAEREAVFHLFFRKNPFGGGYALVAGLEPAMDLMENFAFSEDDLAYLAGLRGNDGAPLFDPAFIDFLRAAEFACDVDAMPEGTPAFPHEPLLRIKGPLWQCQLLETPLLTVINFQTLVATKASRIMQVAGNDTVLEFGLRRAQGIDGGLSASRAAYVGGVHATSNVLAGKLYDIPVRGTHAHSWVMAHDTEMEAFAAYARAMPNNCVFLVDTYDTLEGVRKAAEMGRRLRELGHEMIGVRLDSGDLAELSIQARKILDVAGLPEVKIVASNDLNDHSIADLKARGAQIAIWGVGTKLATSYDQPALGGVYKLSAIRDAGGSWEYKVKLSEQLIKVSNPGVLQVRRLFREGRPVADLLYNEEMDVKSEKLMNPVERDRWLPLPTHDAHTDLLRPVFRNGKLVAARPSLDHIRNAGKTWLQQFPEAIRQLTVETAFPVGLEENLHALKLRLINAARHGQ
ncbi:MAG: nicotinate phosphoribosyltransferase [Bacteroidota bacterium]